MKCIILAGGFATRLWPLTETKAKPLLHLGKGPLISSIVEKIPETIPIIVSTNAVFEKSFREWAKDFSHRDIEIFIEDSGSDEFKKGALGATALVIQERKIEEDLLLLAGDNYFDFEVTDFISAFKNNPLLAAHDVGDKEKAKAFGVVVEKNGKALEFQEKPDHPKSSLVGTGCYIFPQKNLKDIIHYAKDNHDNLGGIFEYFMEKKQEVDVFKFKELWIDIGSYTAYLKANKILLNNKVIEKEGVKKEGKNEFNKGVYLGKKVEIKDSIIESSVILDGCKIENCVLHYCVIDENCELKNIDLSFKMIRQGSKITK